jgi:hypothetical protein
MSNSGHSWTSSGARKTCEKLPELVACTSTVSASFTPLRTCRAVRKLPTASIKKPVPTGVGIPACLS